MHRRVTADELLPVIILFNAVVHLGLYLSAQVKTQLGFMEPELCSEHLRILTSLFKS